jgi:hypothetical protein
VKANAERCARGDDDHIAVKQGSGLFDDSTIANMSLVALSWRGDAAVNIVSFL